ncbi:MAG: tRNA 2-thiouridine(34) synthase MnmA [Spirochaetales bacterium]|nr:tRNA 2-thiouridine(34) synthase MnmA [Spirochaetales bacterium]
MKVAALLSGGVDSSVALLKLCEAGHDVQAFYLKVWLEDDALAAHCPWEEDLEYARAVAENLQVPLEIIALQHAYRDTILSYTLEQIKAGFTPNPDMLCNNHIKFGAFVEAAGEHFDRIATGHYAGTQTLDHGVALVRARDRFKDQTYFLARLGQKQLRRALFPLSGMQKREVREQAARASLPTAGRRDSQGLCFLGKISFSDFLAARLGRRPGPFVEEESGQIVGEHQGYWFYTIGQRRGLSLSGGPWYVTRRDILTNQVFISRDYFSADKPRNRFVATGLHWNLDEPESQIRTSGSMRVKLRHGEQEYSCHFLEESTDRVVVQIEGHDQGIAPGQFAVFYHEDICLGSAVISS